MRNFKKVLALLLSITMVLGLGVAAFAANSSTEDAENPGFTLEIKNSSENITLENQNFYAFKLFDVTYNGEGAYAYSIKTDNKFYSVTGNKTLLDQYFTFTASANDATVMVVTLKEKEVADANGKEPGEEGYVSTKVPLFDDAAARKLADDLTAWVEDNKSEATVTGKADTDSTDKVVYAKSGSTETVTITIPSEQPGYYLVYNKATIVDEAGEHVPPEVTAAVKLDTTNPKAEVQVKADAPQLDKVFDGTTPKKINNGSIGDNVPYKVTSKVPDMNGYTVYTFKVHDTMSTGLTFNDDITVKITGATPETLPEIVAVTSTVDGESVTKYYPIKTTTDVNGKVVPDFDADGKVQADMTKEPVTAGYIVTRGQNDETFVIDIYNFIQYASLKGKDIEIKYSATVNENAIITEEPNTNEAHLEYSNKPSTPTSTGNTPDSITETYVTAIEIYKYYDNNGTKTKLPGAVFKIEGEAINVTIINAEIYEKFTGEADNETTYYYRLKSGDDAGTYTSVAPTTSGVDTDLYEDPTGATKYVKVTKVTKEYNAAGKKTETVGASDANGNLVFSGLEQGLYTITEIEAPDGYNLLAKPYYVYNYLDVVTTTTEATADTPASTTTTATWHSLLYKGEGTPTAPDFDSLIGADKTYKDFGAWYEAVGKDTWTDLSREGNKLTTAFDIDVENKSGTELPSTGGIGTTIFYIVGGLLAVGAGVVLVSKKRMGKVDD